jgi:hypothetical protein
MREEGRGFIRDGTAGFIDLHGGAGSTRSGRVRRESEACELARKVAWGIDRTRGTIDLERFAKKGARGHCIRASIGL